MMRFCSTLTIWRRASSPVNPIPNDESDATAVGFPRAAVAKRSVAERHVIEAIRTVHETGMRRSAIGASVGTSGEPHVGPLRDRGHLKLRYLQVRVWVSPIRDGNVDTGYWIGDVARCEDRSLDP